MAVEKKIHQVEMTHDGLRYRAKEENGKVAFTRDGSPAGSAKWDSDKEEFVNSTAVLPDAVVMGLEKKLKEEIARRYFE
ncbi:MAG: hypothetical protein U0359_03425 [Byssovorax sp.]